MDVGIIPYGLDLLNDGTLGPGTIGRLQKALQVYREFPDAEIVVSASIDPTRPEQTVTMGQQMATWLIAQGVSETAIVVGTARTFNTEGEQDVGISRYYGYEIHISSWWHVPRIAVMRSRRGVAPSTKVSYRACIDVPPLKAGMLEIGKFFACLLLPKAQQQVLARGVKKLMRTSY